MLSLINKIKKILPGFILVAVLSFISNYISQYFHIGSVAIVILLGFLYSNILGLKETFLIGVDFSEKHLLNISIILMGFNFTSSTLIYLEPFNFVKIIFFVFFSFLSIILFARIFDLSKSLTILLGFGNAVCGSSAIAAASTVLKAKKDEILLSISIINLIGALSIFIVPSMIQFLSINNFSNQAMIIGGTIQAVGQVSAAGYLLSDQTGELSIIVKMFRIILLGPMLIILSILVNSKTLSIKNQLFSIPYFIVGFVLVVFLQVFNIFPLSLVEFLKMVSKIFLMFAMCSIGLKVSFSSIANKGGKIFVASFLAFILQVLIVIQIVT